MQDTQSTDTSERLVASGEIVGNGPGAQAYLPKGLCQHPRFPLPPETSFTAIAFPDAEAVVLVAGSPPPPVRSLTTDQQYRPPETPTSTPHTHDSDHTDHDPRPEDDQ